MQSILYNYNLKPYIFQVTNKTEEQLKAFTKKEYESSVYFEPMLETLAYTYSLNPFTDLVLAAPEELDVLMLYFKSLGIEVMLYKEEAIEYVFKNEAHLFEDGSILFMTALFMYICQNFTIDDVLDKINMGLEITEADKLILGNFSEPNDSNLPSL